MENIPVFVGLDYHSASVQVCVVDQQGRMLVNKRCGNSVFEITQAVGRGREVRSAIVESCCGAADLAEALIDPVKGPAWPVSLAHAGYVSRMKSNPDKSDYSDARLLAELGRAGLVPKVWLPSRAIRGLRKLVRTRAALVDQARATKTRTLGVLRQERISEPGCGRWSKRWMEWIKDERTVSEEGKFVIHLQLGMLAYLREQIALIEKKMAETTREDVAVQMLLGIKGIGVVTAWTMRAMIGRFDRFTSGKHLARFCAVTPRNASSGQRVADSGMIRAGDPLLKTVVIEAAQRLRRYEPRWRALSDAMASRGKPTSVIVGAIANRWLRGLFHQIKHLSADLVPAGRITQEKTYTDNGMATAVA
ncbi:MAG: IS110 family transposase [Phycisphaeraceae bacterium]|nr:IS110 family transposase [Phycisphaeraceae bacterium]